MNTRTARSKSVLVRESKRIYTKRKSENTENIENEPSRKLRKLSPYVQDDPLEQYFNGLIRDRNIVNYFSKYAIPASIYKCMAHRNNKFLLHRNFNMDNFKPPESTSVDDIADYLSTVKFHEQLQKPKSRSSKSSNRSPKYQFNFHQFMDSETQKDWKTVEANLIVDLIYLTYDRRKNRRSFLTERLLKNQPLPCDSSDDTNKPTPFVIDYSKIVNKLKYERITKILLNFKILAKEKKVSSRNLSEKSSILYPVTYDTILPIYNHYQSDKHQGLIQSGSYELFLTVTDMETCDDAPYRGILVPVEYDSQDAYGSEDVMTDTQFFNSNWQAVTVHHNMKKTDNQQKILFDIECLNILSAHSSNSKIITRSHSISNSSSPTVLPPLIRNSPGKSHANELLFSLNKQSNVPSTSTLPPLVLYAFYVGDKIIQWTKSFSFDCPWCFMKMQDNIDHETGLGRLLQHLNNFHPKFICTNCTPKSKSDDNSYPVRDGFVVMTVQVGLSEDFDHGMGVGLKSSAFMKTTDLSHFDESSSFTNFIPAKRMPITEVIWSKFDCPAATDLQPVSRQYYHSWTAQEMTNYEVENEIDSEDDENYDWLKEFYYIRNEEFLDINQSEKRIMDLWNQALLKHGLYVNENQMDTFVMYFINQTIIGDPEVLCEMKSLRNTLLLHLVNLIDFGVLSGHVLSSCFSKLDEALDNCDVE